MLKQKLQADQLQALKSGKKDQLNTLRLIVSRIKNKEIEKQTELTDDEAVAVIRKFAKELQEAIDSAKNANRQDLIDINTKELDFVKTYLPAEISDTELENEIRRIIKANQDLYAKSPKAIIGVCMKELKNKADSSRILKAIQSATMVS